MFSYCGLDCSRCEWKGKCSGCRATDGKPFGGNICPIAKCCCEKGLENCTSCGKCLLKEKLIAEFNALKIDGMPEITELFPLSGSIVNTEYVLPGGMAAKFWKDEDIYWGAQVEKANSDRCFGLAADNNYLLVSEYGENGKDAHIVIFKHR